MESHLRGQQISLGRFKHMRATKSQQNLDVKTANEIEYIKLQSTSKSLDLGSFSSNGFQKKKLPYRTVQ
jgi:hypothetical protein